MKILIQFEIAIATACIAFICATSLNTSAFGHLNRQTTPTAYAQTNNAATNNTSSSGFGVGVPLPGANTQSADTQNFTGYTDWIQQFYTFALRLGAILTILMLVYSGYRYMTSQGNPSNINEAKDIMIGSLSGYALLLLVWLILRLLGIQQ